MNNTALVSELELRNLSNFIKYSFCYYCNPEIIDSLTIPMARPSIAYNVYVPRFCYKCAINNYIFHDYSGIPWYLGKQDLKNKIFSKFYFYMSKKPIPVTFNEKYICKRIYLPIQDKYYLLENYVTSFKSIYNLSNLLLNQYLALSNFIPYILNGLKLELVINSSPVTSFSQKKIYNFLSILFPKRNGNFTQFTVMQTSLVNFADIDISNISHPELIIIDFPKKIIDTLEKNNNK